MAPRGGQAQPSARRARVVVQPAPQRPGGLTAPLHPSPQHLLRLLEGAPRVTGVMSLSRPFTERDYAPLQAEGAQQIKPRSRVSEWPVADKRATFKELLVLGATAEEARDIAGAALQQWEAVQAVSTVILVQSAAKAHCSVERLLRALNLSRADLEVHGGALHCQPLTLRGPWECATEGEIDPAPPGHTLRIRWRRAANEGEDQEDQDMLGDGGEGVRGQLDGAEPPPLQDPQPLGGAAQVRVAITLDPQLLLGQGEKRRARGWTRATVQNFLREFVAPCDPSSYRMHEAGDAQGKRCEASVVLPLVQAQAVIRASGKHKGITCRPWMQGGDSPVPGGMLWVRLPASARAPLPALWAKLSSDPQICGQFGGLIHGDQEGRVGIRFFGAQQVPQGVAQAVGDLLGAQIAPRKVVVGVGGYPIHYGLPEDGWAAFSARASGGIRGGRGGRSHSPVRAPPALGVCWPALGPHPDRGPRGLARGLGTLIRLPGPRSGVGGQGGAAPPPASPAPRKVPQGAGSPSPLGGVGTGGGWRRRCRCGGRSAYGGSRRRCPRAAHRPPVALLVPRWGGGGWTPRAWTPWPLRPSLTQGGTGKALLECGDVEPNPGPCLGGVLPLTPAMLALLAIQMVGLGDLWLWAAQPVPMWPAAAAEAPLLGVRVQSCEALPTLECAHACRGVQLGQFLVLACTGVQSCQAPALNCAKAQSCQALMARQRTHASSGIQPVQGLGLPSAGSSLVRPQQL